MCLEFLSLYEAEPIIWNPRDPNYKNRNLMYDAWKRIEGQMSIKSSITELKNTKDTLMGTFRKLLQKVRASSKTGSGTDDVFKPEWFAYDFMYRFLQGIYLPNQTTDSGMLHDEGRTEGNENGEGKKSEGETVTEEVASQSQSRHPKVKGLKRKIHLAPDIDQKIDEAYKVFKNLADTQMSPPDPSSLYGELLATKLRALDANTREMAKIEIDLLVYRLKHKENSKQHFGQMHLQNVPTQPRALFPHNSNVSNQYQVNFEPDVQHTFSRPSSTASSQYSLHSNHYAFTISSPSPSSIELSEQYDTITLPLTAQQINDQQTVLPLSSPYAENYSQNRKTKLPSTPDYEM